MQVDLPGWSQIILALVALGGAFGAHRLNKRGQETQTRQQHAAHDLAERAQGFDEMEALVERLNAEIARIESKADRDALTQAMRCRAAFDQFMASFLSLVGQVGTEEAKRNAEHALTRAERHRAEDHPETD